MAKENQVTNEVETVETTVTTEAVETTEKKKPTAEPVDYPRPKFPQPAEDMSTYGTQWVYLTDLMYVGNVRTVYNDLEPLAASIMERGMVARAVVVQPEHDCLSTVVSSEIEYSDFNIVLNTAGKDSVHILDAHRRTLALLLAQQHGINFVVGLDEYENEVIENIKLPDNYRVPVTLYTEPISSNFERKLIQYEFSKSEDINQFDLLNLSLECAVVYNEETSSFAKSREIKHTLSSHLADQTDASRNNFITAVRNIVRFMFGGEENMPRNPENISDYYNEDIEKLMLLLRNNHVAVSSLGHALKKKVKATKDWAVTLADMLEFIETAMVAEGRTIDEEVVGNPTVAKKKLVDWIDGKTQIATAELKAAADKLKAKLSGEETPAETPAGSEVAGSEVADDDVSGLDGLDDLSMALSQGGSIKDASPFEDLVSEIEQYAVTEGQSAPSNYIEFLKLADAVAKGDKTIAAIFTFFKQEGVADLVEDDDLFGGLDDLELDV